MDLTARLEAILFVAGDPVDVSALARALGVESDVVEQALDTLQHDIERDGSGLRVLRSLEGIQLVTAPEAQAAVEAFLTASMREKLTPAAAETLSIIAYRGPISRAGIEAIRGVNSSFTLRLLALRGLVAREPHPTDRRSYVYQVSAEFLRHLGALRVADLPEYEALHAHVGMTKLMTDAETAANPAPDVSPSPRSIPDAG